ncbi:MAG: EamA family transporter [Rhodospirillales bacterium]
MGDTTSPILPVSEDTPVRAVLLIVFAISIFSVQDVILRLMSGDYPLLQILVLRAVVVIVLMAGFLWMRGSLGVLRPTRIGLLTVRAFLVFLSFVFYYLALVSIPMAAAVAIYFVAPLILTGMAAALRLEEVGIRRWMAVGVGLVGVIVIMRPGMDSIDPAALLALAGAFVYAGFNLMTRRLGRTENAWILSFSHNLIGYLVIAGVVGGFLGTGAYQNESHPALGFLTRPWVIPALTDLGLIALTGLIASVGFYCLTEGYRSAPSSLAAPFEYVMIPWAVLWGLLIWDEVPHPMTWLGMALILGSGLYVIYRERNAGQRIVTRRFTRWRP